MNKESGRLLVISGPSGVGKTTIVRALLKELENLARSISYTTRPRRPGEQNGKDYHFVTKSQFEELIKRGEFLEYARVFGHYYGTSKHEIEDLLKSGVDVVKELDVQGAAQLRRQGRRIKIPRPIFIFILPPCGAELMRRLARRATESEKQRLARLKTAQKELAEAHKFDHIIINRSVKETVKQIKKIVLRARN